MKKKSLLFIFVLGGLMSCQNDFISETGNESTLQEGNRITIIGDSSKVMSRGNVQFTGGTATGAGLYHASERPPVEAIPNPGYEIDYFFGGPVNGDRHTYDFAKSQESLFKVNMEPGDNIFEVKFKPVMRNVKITAGNGGSVTPSGETQYQVSVPHQISATANNGYAFSHWTATSGINITESSFSNTTFVLDANSSGGTITANFKQSIPTIWFSITTRPSKRPGVYDYIVKADARQDLPTNLSGSINYSLEGISRHSSISGIIQAGKRSGEQTLYSDTNPNPELKIESVYISMPDGWQAKW